MSSEHLSDDWLQALQPAPGRWYQVRDTLVRNLAVWVGPTGIKRFVVVAPLPGTASVVCRAIGTFPEIPLARARQIATTRVNQPGLNGSPCARVLSNDLLQAYWVAAGATAQPDGPFYKACILTVQQPREVAGMLWSRVDFARGIWSILRHGPGGPHLVPLVPEMLTLLEALRRSRSETAGDFVFSATDGWQPIKLSSKARQKFKRCITDTLQHAHPEATTGHWTMHDIRRTAWTWLVSRGVPNDVIATIFGWRQFEPGMLLRGRRDLSPSREALSLWAAHLTAGTRPAVPPQAP